MYIKLNVKKETFTKSLIKIGYNYRINQYDDFISSIKRIILRDISIALVEDTLEKVLFEIFDEKGSDIPLIILSNEEKISFIREEYLKKIIEQSLLDLYIEEMSLNFSKEVQKRAYEFSLVNDLKFNNNSRRNSFIRFKIPYLYDKNCSQYISASKCLNVNGIDLSEEEKEEVERGLKEKIIDQCYFYSPQRSIVSRNIFIYSLNKYKIDEKDFQKFLSSKLEDKLTLDRIVTYMSFETFENNRKREIIKILNYLRNNLKITEKRAMDIIRLIKDSQATADEILDFKNWRVVPEMFSLREIGSRAEKTIRSIYPEIKEYNLVDLSKETVVLNFSGIYITFSYQEVIDFVEGLANSEE